MPLEKPKLIMGVSIQRGRYWKQFLRALLLVVVVAAAYFALDEAARRGLVEARWLDIGRMAAVVLIVLLAVRGLFNLIVGFFRRNETVRFYDQGFVWTRGKQQYKYAWHQLERYREGTRGIYLLGRWPLLQWGANVFTMADGTVFNYNHRFGDTRPCTEAVRRYTAYVTGVRMGRTLRGEQPVKLHPRLTVLPTGLETRKQDIHWSDADVRMEGGRLVIRSRGEDGRFRVVARYPRHKVDNVGGFLELASSTIRNYQPERFRRKGAKTG